VEKSKFKILIAEDDEMVRDVVIKFLTDEGFYVGAAKDGLDAIRLMGLEDFNMIITDLRMPGADGMEVLRTALQYNPRLPVVLFTAYGTLDTVLDAMKAGAYDYIVKPFVMQQLLIVVRNAYNLVTLTCENEMLSSQLRETYRNLETVRTLADSKDTGIISDSVERVEKLQELDIINGEEADIIKERLVSGNENIKKYTSLVQDLKGTKS
jgi:DNA-binding NtrC family response regulator